MLCMNNFSLLAGIIPLLVFVLVDTFSGLKAALISAVAFALIETVISLYYFGSIDWITGVSFLLVGVMSFFAWKQKDEKLFMWQPVIISWVFALYILGVKLSGSDLFLDMLTKYGSLMPEQAMKQLESPLMQESLKILSWTSSLAFAAHGSITLYAAYKLNKWWWLIARGVGFYLFMALAVFSAQYIVISTYS